MRPHVFQSGLFLAIAATAIVAAPTRADETPKARNLLPAVTSPSSESSSSAWTFWSQRQAIAASSSIEAGTLVLRADRPEQIGAWTTQVSGIQPGHFYRFQVQHRATNVSSEAVNVAAIVIWHKAGKTKNEIQSDYADMISTEADGWCTDARTLRAPDNSAGVSIQLLLRWAPHGSVAFRSPTLVEVPAPPRRVARIITTHLLPSNPATFEGNTRLVANMLDKVAPEHPDLVLFSENFVDRYIVLPFDKKAQPIPGPFTNVLSEKAKSLRSYIVTTLHEADGQVVYNTAVLIDRKGNIVGKYRKVHLALAESEGGLTPGNEYPVFQTDFGKIGILTCWDNWFSEPARILRLKGAEILLFPLAGDGVANHYDATVRTRAMDNGMFLVSCPTLNEIPALIINPAGEVLGRAEGAFSYAVADLDLNQEWRTRYLSVAAGDGEAKSLYIKERRPDTYAPLTTGPESSPNH